jgi:hypothetical protein
MATPGAGGGAIRGSVWAEDEFTGSLHDKRVARTRHRDDDYFEGGIFNGGWTWLNVNGGPVNRHREMSITNERDDSRHGLEPLDE